MDPCDWEKSNEKLFDHYEKACQYSKLAQGDGKQGMMKDVGFFFQLENAKKQEALILDLMHNFPIKYKYESEFAKGEYYLYRDPNNAPMIWFPNVDPWFPNLPIF